MVLINMSVKVQLPDFEDGSTACWVFFVAMGISEKNEASQMDARTSLVYWIISRLEMEGKESCKQIGNAVGQGIKTNNAYGGIVDISWICDARRKVRY